ncbi:putative bifunctional diguanylate cyclase/phosphodiesterase [Deinococcus sp.]|uniref:putative bifunctional diguanylate cyclase/phosphodiesterase n=1 Tax=Deinococcus sp. TaxID=47478 RepID=UPI003C7D0442
MRYSPRPMALVLLLTGLLHGSWLLVRWGAPAAQPYLAGLLYVPVFLTAALCCALRASEGTGRERLPWLGIGLGLLAFGLGQTLFTYYQLVLHTSPFPSPADAFFLIAPLSIGTALVLLPRAKLSRPAWIRLGLEVGIVMAAAAVFSWRFLLSGLIQSYRSQPLAGTIALAYPASDLVLLCLLLLLISRRQEFSARVTVLIAGALTSYIVADSGFAQLSATQSYVPGNVVDLFWSLGGGLFGLSALASSRQPGRDATDARPSRGPAWTTVGPYLAVALTYGLLLQTYTDGVSLLVGRGVLWGTGVVTLLVMVRQALAYSENSRLNAALQQAAVTLEARVETRTTELHTANARLQQFSEDLESKVRSRTAELERSQARLAHQAQHDSLTGLPNRTLFEDRLGQAVATAARHARVLAVLYIDLDGFKLVNDTLGHAAGDEVLRTVAQRLQNLVRQSDTVARLGGDEFTMLLTELSDLASVSAVAHRVLEAVGWDIVIADQVARVTASVGIAMYPDDALDSSGLKRQADVAMYRAKQGGKNNVCFFAPEMNSVSQVRGDLAARLHGAVQRGEFHLVYQPQFTSGTQRLSAFEALLRWTHGELGPVPPSEFIPIAEETGLIAEIGAWVLDEVCRQQVKWRDGGLPLVPVALNVSPVQFLRPGFVQDLRQTLRRHGLDGRWIELEMTERTMLHDIVSLAQKMAEIRSLGTSVSIDDFGAGRTSLSYLLQLPVNKVKIDRSLIQGLGETQSTLRVVQAIVALAHALNLAVVAEGVETHAQLVSVTDLRCEQVQGFLLGLPEAAGTATERLVGLARADRGRPGETRRS